MKTRVYILIASFFILTAGLAQDYHFSQIDANPSFINPALTGERLGDYKGVQFNASYRDQTGQYTKGANAFRSAALTIDEPVGPKFSLAQYVFNNKAATGSFNTFGAMLTGAYKLIDQTADNEGNHNLSVGVQVGVLNKSIYPENFTYDAQYSFNSTDGFDRNLPSGETFVRQSYYELNVNFGVYYRATSRNKKVSGFGGFAIHNLTEPNESYLGGFSPLPLRYVLHGGVMYKATKQLTMMPQVLYMNQAKASELNLSLLMYYKMEGSAYEPMYGFGLRNKNAIIFQLGIKCKGLVFRISYDIITNSSLKEHRNKGLEFSLVSTLKKRIKNKPQATEPVVVGPPQAPLFR